MRIALFLSMLLLCSCSYKPPAKLEPADESWGFVREYTDPKTSIRYLVFIRGSSGIHVIPAHLTPEK